MQRVLVTDAEQRSSLAVVRSLGRAGYHVEVCSSHDAPLGGASRFCRAAHVVPDPTEDVGAFIDRLESLVDQRGVDVLLPMTDVTASTMHELRNRRSSLVIPFPPTETWEAASDKRRLMDLAERLGVPVPTQHVVESPEEDPSVALAFAETVGYPVVLKPHRSAVATSSRVLRFGVEMASDGDDLLRRMQALPREAFPVLVQQRIQGPGLGGFFLARHGRITQRFAHRRLREKPPSGGVSVLRQGVPLRHDVARYSEALLGELAWSGVAMVEFKEDASSGTVYLMEINGRFWGSLQLAIDCGVDFPRALMKMFLDPDSPEGGGGRGESRVGIRTRWFWGDVDHLLWILRAPAGYRAIHPHLPSRIGAIARFMVPWRPGLRYEVLRPSDPFPFVRESRQWFAQILHRREDE